MAPRSNGCAFEQYFVRTNSVSRETTFSLDQREFLVDFRISPESASAIVGVSTVVQLSAPRHFVQLSACRHRHSNDVHAKEIDLCPHPPAASIPKFIGPAKCSKLLPQACQRHPYYVEVTTLNARDIAPGTALNPVSARFVEGLVSGQVPRNFFR